MHAIYVHPAKTASRFPAYAAMFQADARQASAMLQTLGRDIRWDLHLPAGELCSGTTVLDITVLKSRYSAGQLSGGNQFSLVANELAASKKFSVATKKYVVWLDAGSHYCGQGTLYQDTRRQAFNYNDANRTTGIVYRPYSKTNDEGGFCRGRTLLHELGHNLGALQGIAPHAYDGAHCNDDDNDVMCYTAEATHDSGAAQFDYGKDDYWDLGASIPTATNNGYPDLPVEKLGGGSKPAWWALNLSKYICPPGAVGSRPNCAIDNLSPAIDVPNPVGPDRAGAGPSVAPEKRTSREPVAGSTVSPPEALAGFGPSSRLVGCVQRTPGPCVRGTPESAHIGVSARGLQGGRGVILISHSS